MFNSNGRAALLGVLMGTAKGVRLAWMLVVFVTVMSARPALAQMDFSGEWGPVRNQDNTENPLVGDWVGIPLNEAGLARSEAWDASIQSLPEWQCRPHGWAYIYRGPTALRIWRDIDPVSREVTAFHAQWQQSAETPIFLDGRLEPPDYAPYTWMGFSTARWEGNILKIATTHLKEDYLRRNGIFVSDRAKITTYWIRRGDYLTWINIVHDPVYLTEPLIRSGEYRLTLGAQFPPHPCTPADEGHVKGVVPAHLPGKNPFLKEPAAKMKIPDDAIRAGAESMYPEFRAKLGKP
jgi:hypothetical protein